MRSPCWHLIFKPDSPVFNGGLLRSLMAMNAVGDSATAAKGSPVLGRVVMAGPAEGAQVSLQSSTVVATKPLISRTARPPKHGCFSLHSACPGQRVVNLLVERSDGLVASAPDPIAAIASQENSILDSIPLKRVWATEFAGPGVIAASKKRPIHDRPARLAGASVAWTA